MPKGTNQKLKLYYLSRIMIEKTDDEHKITMAEILDDLGKYGVTADRKTIYEDAELIKKLTNMASEYEADQLRRQVVISLRNLTLRNIPI